MRREARDAERRQEAAEAQAARLRGRVAAAATEAQRAVPPEPVPGAPGVCVLALQFPSSARVQRRFAASAGMAQVAAFVQVEAAQALAALGSSGEPGGDPAAEEERATWQARPRGTLRHAATAPRRTRRTCGATDATALRILWQALALGKIRLKRAFGGEIPQEGTLADQDIRHVSPRLPR